MSTEATQEKDLVRSHLERRPMRSSGALNDGLTEQINAPEAAPCEPIRGGQMEPRGRGVFSPLFRGIEPEKVREKSATSEAFLRATDRQTDRQAREGRGYLSSDHYYYDHN